MDKIKSSSTLRQLMLNIGKKVKEERSKRNWEVLELVVRSDVSMGTIYKLESQITDNVSIKSLVGLATAFEMDVKEFLLP